MNSQINSNEDKDLCERMYSSLRLIREAEKRIAEIYPTDQIKSPVHLSIGQEAISVGVCDPLNQDDVVAGTYRGHALYLAKGGSLKKMMAELYGKVTGCSRGKGGSMHLIDPDHSFLGTSAIVGTSIPVAVGHALALKREGKGRVAVVFMGDGATEEGVFYESLNFAALHRLPILFVCENNGYAIYTPLHKRWAAQTICERVSGFGIPTKRIENGDIFAIRQHVSELLPLMRTGETGPAFLECLTYRWLEHVGCTEDFHLGHRSREEMAFWKENDQVERLAKMVEMNRCQQINEDVEKTILEAVKFAEDSPFPNHEELYHHVFAE
jgi:TPP-dependent pyruvate/acetoin dehydrogenase alpha subunit